jgi:hypothetical protein
MTATSKTLECRQEPGIYMPIVNPERREGKAEATSW